MDTPPAPCCPGALLQEVLGIGGRACPDPWPGPPGAPTLGLLSGFWFCITEALVLSLQFPVWVADRVGTQVTYLCLVAPVSYMAPRGPVSTLRDFSTGGAGGRKKGSVRLRQRSCKTLPGVTSPSNVFPRSPTLGRIHLHLEALSRPPGRLESGISHYHRHAPDSFLGWLLWSEVLLSAGWGLPPPHSPVGSQGREGSARGRLYFPPLHSVSIS